ncbi:MULTISPECIES: hypothetical protein [Aurantimonas]|uniref:hypothetical protein n=1 Tax=Aurantimonas TaxID=182269 RepID=UPI003512A6AF
MLTAPPHLRSVAIYEAMLRRHLGSGRRNSRIRSAIKQRARQWRAVHVPVKEVIFYQIHEPGRRGLSDFTGNRQRHHRSRPSRSMNELYELSLAFEKRTAR